MAIRIGVRGIKKIIAEKMKVTKVYVGDMMVYDRTTDPNLLLPLAFIAQEANSRVALTKSGSPAWEGEYSLDNENWLPYVPGTTGDITLANIGDRVYFRGNISDNFSLSNRLGFTMAGRIAAEGNVNSMYVAVDFEELETLTYSYCYYRMFRGCSSLTTAPALPATTLSLNCYDSMFYGCSSLTTAPALPATTLASSCYLSMFNGCSSLTTAPELPATTLASICYREMFRGCSSLTTAPELPATTLASSCYLGMFYGCSSLTTAPALPATTLEGYCYREMFYGCSSLTTAPALPATTLEFYCYVGMFNGCTLIKVSLTKEGIYQNTWQFGGTLNSTLASSMFTGTGGTFTGTPEVDVLYTSNDLV